MAIKKETAWDVAQAEFKKMHPYLADDDLTAVRYANKNNISKYMAQQILNGLVSQGVLRTDYRMRKGQGGHPVQVYVMKGDDESTD